MIITVQSKARTLIGEFYRSAKPGKDTTKEAKYVKIRQIATDPANETILGVQLVRGTWFRFQDVKITEISKADLKQWIKDNFSTLRDKEFKLPDDWGE